MNTEKATLRDGLAIDFLPDMIGDGTMKEVYFTADRQSVVCFYKDPRAANDPVRLQRLEWILGKYNPTVARAQGGAASGAVDAEYYRQLYCWPTGIVVRPRFGLVTPVYPSNFFFGEMPKNLDFLNRKEKNGTRFIGKKNRSLLQKYAPAELGTWINYFKLCIQMARAVARMHNAGLAHSDLSPNNVLADPVQGRSIVIDIDSLVVPGLFPPDVAGTKGYIAPEVLATMKLPLKDPQRKNPSARTDEHALSVLIYQYLLRRHPLEGRRIAPANSEEERDFLTYGSQAVFCEHPADASNRPEENPYVPCRILGPLLNDLFTRVFVDGVRDPNRRPTANEWLNGLIKTWDWLHRCSNAKCPAGWFVLHDPKQVCCPFCKARPARNIPVLQFEVETGPGKPPKADGHLVIYDQISLFKWHAFSRMFPGPDTDRTPQAYCVWHQGQWLLINQQLKSLTSPSGSVVPPGQALALTDGAKFRFSQEENGRLVQVQLLRV